MVGRDCGIETQVIPGGKVSMSKVVFAMMSEAELPSADMSEVDADFWVRMQPPDISKESTAD